MKKKSLFFIFVLGGLMSCQNEFISETGNESTLQEGNRITIIGDSAKVMSRGNVQFDGGTATGAGLYHASDNPEVEAIPYPGYEIDYFYGGPVNDSRKYDYSKSNQTMFYVDMTPGDNIFEVKFKPVMRNVKITAGQGGSVTPSGEAQYQVSVPHQISATPFKGYAFDRWTAPSGINIDYPYNSNANFTIDANSTGGTITANFKKTKSKCTITINQSTPFGGPHFSTSPDFINSDSGPWTAEFPIGTKFSIRCLDDTQYMTLVSFRVNYQDYTSARSWSGAITDDMTIDIEWNRRN